MSNDAKAAEVVVSSDVLKARELKQQGWTARRIASTLGMSLGWVGKWTAGIAPPPPKTSPASVNSERSREREHANGSANGKTKALTVRPTFPADVAPVVVTSEALPAPEEDTADASLVQPALLTAEVMRAQLGPKVLRAMKLATDRIIEKLPEAGLYETVGAFKVLGDRLALLTDSPTDIHETRSVDTKEQAEARVKAALDRLMQGNQPPGAGAHVGSKSPVLH